MVGNIPGLVVAIVAGVKSVVGLINDIKSYTSDIVSTIEKAQGQLDDMLKKLNANKAKLRSGITGQLKAKEGAAGITAAFINNIFGYDFFNTLSKLSGTVGEVKDKLNSIKLKHSAAGKELDGVLDQQQELQKAARRLEQEEMPEAIEAKVAEMAGEIERSGAQIDKMLTAVGDQGTGLDLLQKAYDRLKDTTDKLCSARPGLKWLELTGQLLGTAATFAANQLAAAPEVVLQGASLTLTLSKDVLSYSSSISTGAATITGLVKDYT